MRRIVAQEGAAGLYAGLDSAIFGISITNFVYYYWYEWTRSFFQRATAARTGRAASSAIKLTTVESIIAGALAGSATVILTNPIWVINTRMTTRAAQQSKDAAAATAVATTAAEEKKTEPEVEEEKGEKENAEPEVALERSKKEATAGRGKKPSNSTMGTLLALLREEGPQALFRGVVPALVLVANPILQYTLFEQMKNLAERRQRARGQAAARITPTMAFFLGALGKLFATSVTYPYITVKSRMHVAAAGPGERREGVTGALARVVHEEGYAGLYKGEFLFIPATLTHCTSPKTIDGEKRRKG